MDFTHPTEDLLKYDTKIQEIERNLRELERQYWFSRCINPFGGEVEDTEQPQTFQCVPASLTSKARYLNKPQDQPRYKNLVSLDAEKPRILAKHQEITQKCQIVFANQPDIKQFYNQDAFNPSHFNTCDFQTNINLLNSNAVFNDSMDLFALEVL